MTDHPISRRRFIQASTAVAAVAAGGCATTFQPVTSFSADERKLVEAIADQIVPPDQDPGGRDTSVAEFLDVQLRGPYARHAAAYHDGLARLEQTCQRLHHRSFTAMSFDEQTAVLTALERGQVPDGIWPPGDAAEFFNLVCDHCMQGFYGSPRHGGNRNGASWKMLGLDYPQVAGRVVIS